MLTPVLPFILISFEIAVYLSMDMYMPALPFLASEFSISQDLAQYTVTSWFLGAVFAQILMGPLSDKFGRRPCLLIGSIIFVVSCYFCATTDNFYILMLARMVQGTTVSLPLVAGYAAIHESFNDKQAMKIIAMMGAITILAPALGPIFGAIIIYMTNWRVIFTILSIWALLSLILMYFKLPETLTESHPLELKRIASNFKNILCNKRFLQHVIPLNFAIMALMIWMIESPFIIIEIYKCSVVTFGLIQFILFSLFICGGQFSRILLEKNNSTNFILHRGFLIILIGCITVIGLSLLWPEKLFVLAAGLSICTFGVAMIFGPANRLAISACSEPMGVRTAVFSSLMNLFGILGTIIITLLNNGTMLRLIETMAAILLIAVILGYKITQGDVETHR